MLRITTLALSFYLDSLTRQRFRLSPVPDDKSRFRDFCARDDPEARLPTVEQ